MTKQIRSVALAVCVGAFFPFLLPVAEAKQQCNAAQPENQHGHWWSYRIIDGRKCWYEGKPGLSKSMLEWPPRVSSAQRLRPHGSYPTTAKNYLRRNAGCRHPRPSDLLLRLSLQPLDSDQRGPVGRRRQAVRSRATICLQGLRQERCRRPARFRLQQEGAGR